MISTLINIYKRKQDINEKKIISLFGKYSIALQKCTAPTYNDEKHKVKIY